MSPCAPSQAPDAIAGAWPCRVIVGRISKLHSGRLVNPQRMTRMAGNAADGAGGTDGSSDVRVVGPKTGQMPRKSRDVRDIRVSINVLYYGVRTDVRPQRAELACPNLAGWDRLGIDVKVNTDTFEQDEVQS